METPVKYTKVELFNDGTNDYFVEVEFDSKDKAEAFIKQLKIDNEVDKELEHYEALHKVQRTLTN